MTLDEGAFKESFRAGMEALKTRHCPDAKVVAVDGNFAYIDLGDGTLPAIYAERNARVFARVPLDFPNAEPYGVVTAPYLHRADTAPIERHHSSHPHSKPIETALGLTDIGFWSWDWQRMPRKTPEDLSHIYEWAWKRIRQG